MNWPPESKSWLEFPSECLWYLVPGVVHHIVALVATLAFMSLLRRVWKNQPRISTILYFHGYLLMVAMIANGLWSCAVWGNHYWSVDYISDFSVFFPISRATIKHSWGSEMSGGFNGVTLAELNLIWVGFGVGVWLIALALTLWTERWRRSQQIRPM